MKTNFIGLYKKYYKNDSLPLFDFRENEVRITVLMTIIFILLIGFYGFTSSVMEITSSIKSITAGFAFALIGLLGFIITGLSVLLGTTSEKYYMVLIKNNLKTEFEKILFSFYFLGFLVGIVFALSLLNYFLISLEIPFYIIVFLFLAVIYIYLIFFVVFYAISLLGVCFIFFLTKLSAESFCQQNEEKLDNLFLQLKIEALSDVLFEEKKSDDYFKSIHRLLNTKFIDNKEELSKMIIEFYQLDKK